MPRELTRRPERFQILQGELGFDIHEQGTAVRVALFGVLDSDGLEQLVRRVTPRLRRRGRKVVLDGSRLEHVDYRAVPSLVAWNHVLRSFDHTLMLSDWNSYLKSILLVGDWGGGSVRVSGRRLIAERPSGAVAGSAALRT